MIITLVGCQLLFYKSGASQQLSISAKATIMESCDRSQSCQNYFHNPPPPPRQIIVLPNSQAYTPATWASELLRRGGWSQTDSNIKTITAWEFAEGGHWQNTASFNPLNTTLVENNNNRPINDVGVQRYSSWDEGFKATLDTLALPRYAAVRYQLQRGDNSSSLINEILKSGWGTKSIARG